MEYLIIFLITITGTFLFKNHSKNTTEKNIERVGEKSWIIGNDFIDLEEDTPLNNGLQELEDQRHYNDYVLQRLKQDNQKLMEDFMQTKIAIRNNPSLLKCITEEKLEAITAKYEHYKKMSSKLGHENMLSKEEFLIKTENPIQCEAHPFGDPKLFSPEMAIYTIHNSKTAKYAKGDMNKMMEKEFKKEYY